MAARVVEEYKLAEVSIPGVVHVEAGALVVGDSNIAATAARAWGGGRQQGRVVVQIYVEPQLMTITNPDMGVGLEASEPLSGLG